MTDVFTVPKRKQIMSRIKGRNTAPERIVRRYLRKLGCRFETYDEDLPGNPDIVLRSLKKVIFVHGCFWHKHKNCARAALPKTNRSFWKKKIAGNAIRDEAIKRKLRRMNWRSLTLWQCKVSDSEYLENRINKFLKRR